MWKKTNILFAVLLLLLLLLHCCWTITVTDEPIRVEEESKPSTYRLSVAKSQEASNRVPAHLQGVHLGYAYDDADDVIHIIEPPKYFQQLKRLINQKGQATIWEQQRKVHISRPSEMKRMPVELAPMKVKEHDLPMRAQVYPKITKVDLQAQKMHTASIKPQATTIDMKGNSNGGGSGVSGSGNDKMRNDVGAAIRDLQTQETQQHVGAEQFREQLHFPSGLPMQILASVRKTERLIHKQRPSTKTTMKANTNTNVDATKHAFVKPVPMPAARQRIKSKKLQTVILEKRFEREKFQRAKEHKFGGEKMNSHRRKTMPMEQLSRSKRAASDIQPNTRNSVVRAENDKKGVELLKHITELVNNATVYLKNDEHSRELGKSNSASVGVDSVKTPKANSQFDFNRKTTNFIENVNDELKDAYNIYRLLNSTDVVPSKITPSDEKDVKNVPNKKYGERIRAKTTQTNIPSDEAHIRVKKQRHHTQGRSQATPSISEHNVGPSAALLYDDVMTNIRNMLQLDNLSLLEDEQIVAARKVDDAVNSAPRFIPPDEVKDDEHLKELNTYLKHLQELMHMPQQRVIQDITLNTREFLTNANTPEAVVEKESSISPWFLINSNGNIYETDLNDKNISAVTVFYRFPDIPNAELYISNRTLFTNTNQSNVVEIL